MPYLWHAYYETVFTLLLENGWREACERHGVRLTIGFVRRFDPFWGCMRKIVESGLLGDPVIWRSVSPIKTLGNIGSLIRLQCK